MIFQMSACLYCDIPEIYNTPRHCSLATVGPTWAYECVFAGASFVLSATTYSQKGKDTNQLARQLPSLRAQLLTTRYRTGWLRFVLRTSSLARRGIHKLRHALCYHFRSKFIYWYLLFVTLRPRRHGSFSPRLYTRLRDYTVVTQKGASVHSTRHTCDIYLHTYQNKSSRPLLASQLFFVDLKSQVYQRQVFGHDKET